jgi:hypothetical protein
LPNCWRPIFLVLPKLDGCQIDLPNYWSCSKRPSSIGGKSFGYSSVTYIFSEDSAGA